MNTHLQAWAKGNFLQDPPQMNPNIRAIEVNIEEGQEWEGSFSLEIMDGREAEVFVSTTLFGLSLSQQRFFGNQITIPYKFYEKGLKPGESREGFLVLVSQAGERKIPVRVICKSKDCQSSLGRIHTLKELTELAKEFPIEAFRIFCGKEFPHIFLREDPKALLLYHGLTQGRPTEHDMEQFLIGLGYKDPIRISLNQYQCQFSSLNHSVKDRIMVQKTGWGYIKAEINVDADFLVLEKKQLGEQDFNGSVYGLEYIVDISKLHYGYNFGRIQIKTEYQTEVCQVSVYKEGKDRIQKEDRRRLRQNYIALEQGYIDFRLHKIQKEDWIAKSMRLTEEMRELQPKDLFPALFESQLLFIKGEEEESKKRLEEVEKLLKKADSPTLRAYQLYLSTFFQEDAEYPKTVIEKIKKLYQRNSNSWFILWTLLYLETDYDYNPHLKWKQLKKQFITEGCRSKVMYFEALALLRKEPGLLKSIGRFELQVLYWAVKEKAVSEEMASQLAALIHKEKEDHPFIYRILTMCATQYPSDEMTGAVCHYLIKNNRYGKKWVSWYEKAVERHLKITQIYEFYLMSLPRENKFPIPREMLMYFAYNNTMSDRDKSFLYANVLTYYKEDLDIYGIYKEAISDFLIDQILKEQINENLAVLYNTCLTPGIVNSDTAPALARIGLIHKITCNEEKIQKIHVVHRQMANSISGNVIQGRTYLPIYREEYCLIFQDGQGRNFEKNIDVTVEKLFLREDILEACRQYEIKDLGFQVHFMDYRNMNRLEGVRISYRPVVIQNLLQKSKHSDEMLSVNELCEIDGAILDTRSRALLIERLIEHSRYTKAYEHICTYGCEGVETVALVKLCSIMIRQKQYEQDRQLLFFCMNTFFRGKYNQTMLEYLVEGMQGTVFELVRLWISARGFQLETSGLEETLIQQMIETNTVFEGHEEVFRHYYKQSPREWIVMAYLSYFSYQYFIHKWELSEDIVTYIKKARQTYSDISDICKFALLYYYSEKKEWTDSEYEMVNGYLEEMVSRQIGFGFFGRYPEALQKQFQFQDKIYLEFQTNPGSSVVLHMRIDQDGTSPKEYEQYTMQEVYPGYFVKECVLFLDESICCYVEELRSNGEIRKTEPAIVKNEIKDRDRKDRFGWLNQMLQAKKEKDLSLEEMVKAYSEQDALVRRLFRIR